MRFTLSEKEKVSRGTSWGSGKEIEKDFSEFSVAWQFC